MSARFYEHMESGTAKYHYLSSCDTLLIDLGGASTLQDNLWGTIITRQYRSPEVVL